MEAETNFEPPTFGDEQTYEDIVNKFAPKEGANRFRKLQSKFKNRGRRSTGAFSVNAKTNYAISNFLDEASNMSREEVCEYLENISFDVNEWFSPHGSFFYRLLTTSRHGFVYLDFEMKEFIFNKFLELGAELPCHVNTLERSFESANLDVVVLLLHSGLLWDFQLPKRILLTKRTMRIVGALSAQIRKSIIRRVAPAIEVHNINAVKIRSFLMQEETGLSTLTPDLRALILSFTIFIADVDFERWNFRVS